MIVELSPLSISRYHEIKRMFDSGFPFTAGNLAAKTVRGAPAHEKEKLRHCFSEAGIDLNPVPTPMPAGMRALSLGVPVKEIADAMNNAAKSLNRMAMRHETITDRSFRMKYAKE